MGRSRWRVVVAVLWAAVASASMVAVGFAAAPAPPPATGGAVLVAAGDVEGCGKGEATAKLIEGIDGAVAALGDNAYPDGSAGDYTRCYDPTWGQFKSRTRPVPGNHDYSTPHAAGYFRYFGALAGPPDAGYYSYDVGTWHVVAMNSNCDSIDCAAETQWLDSDLSAHPTPCTLAYWHHPRFSSGSAGGSSMVNPFWKVLYNHRATIVLSGHDHDYERFAPQDAGGRLDPDRGIRQFVVGTGGGTLGHLSGPRPNSQARSDTTFGVLKLTLRSDGYDWQFIPADKGFTDSGSDTCGATTATTSPPPATTVTPTGEATPGPEPTSPEPSALATPMSPGSEAPTGPPSTPPRSGLTSTSTAPSRSTRPGRRPPGDAAVRAPAPPAITNAGGAPSGSLSEEAILGHTAVAAPAEPPESPGSPDSAGSAEPVESAEPAETVAPSVEQLVRTLRMSGTVMTTPKPTFGRLLLGGLAVLFLVGDSVALTAVVRRKDGPGPVLRPGPVRERRRRRR